MPSDNAGNTLATANVLQVSTGLYQKSLTDRVDSLDPVDYYRFQVAGRSSLSVAVSQLSGDVTLSLLKSDGTLVQSSANSASASELLTRTLDAGTYYLQVTPASPNEGSDYALDFQTQNNPKADITWRNTNGLNAVWNMDGTTIGNSFYLTTVHDPNWQMSGVGDFNGDGQSDYLWRYLPTGQNVIWQMNNGTIATVRSLFTVDSSWKINLAADLNNDGTSDILWQRNSGENVVWYMNNGQFLSGDSLFTVADQDWKLSATGDFNQDGRTDLVWRHRLSGNNIVWHMNGSTFINVKSLTTVSSQDWTLEGSGDFNSDGKSDLVWRNSNGTNVVWHMVAGEIVGTAPLIYVDPSWQITGVTTRFEAPSPIDRAGSTYSTAFNIGNLSALNSELGQGGVSFSDRVSSQDKDDYYSFTTSSYQAFTFNLTGLSADANMQIIRSDGSGFSIIATANNLGTASEVIAQTLKPGTYYVRVFQNSGDTNYSLSLNAAPARLQVTSPTASNIAAIGGLLNITWTDNISENVKLELYKGNTLVTTIANSVPSTGSYSWNIPTTLNYGEDYQILASSVVNPEFRSFNGQSFTIGSPTYKYEFTYFYNGVNNTSDYYTGWVYTAKDRYTIGSSVDANPSNNQSGMNGRYSITSGTAATNIAATQLGQVFVNGYYDRDLGSTASYTPWKFSQGQAAGTTYLGSEEDTIGSPTKPFGDVKNFTDFGRDNFKFDAWEAPIDTMYQINTALLGTQVGTYNSATTSPFGTKGIVIGYSSGGTIHWSQKTGARVITKAFTDVYGPTGGSGGFLGFATGNQLASGGGTRQEFEGGYIYHDGQTGRSFKPTETPVIKYNFTYFYSGLSSNVADRLKSDYYMGWTVANEGMYSVNQFVDINSGLNEAGKNGQYYITQATLLGSSSELISQDRGKVWVNQYFNQETAETIIPLNATQSIGNNFLGSESGFLEVANNSNFDFGRDAFEFDRFIRVDSPNAAQSINAGSSQTITWTDTINENVKIELYQGTSFISTIANNVLSNGSFTWQLPTTLSGSDFRIRVASMTNTTILDSSDVGFTINKPTPVGPYSIIDNLIFSGLEGDSGRFKIRLNQSISSDVIVTFENGSFMTIDADNDIRNGTQSTITFTSQNWNIAQDISFIAEVDDSASDRTNNLIQCLLSGGLTSTDRYNFGTFKNTYTPDTSKYNIDLDFRNDYLGFWNASRRGIAQKAASDWASRIATEISSMKLTNQKIGQVANDGKFGFEFVSNRIVDDLVIFIGSYSSIDGAGGWGGRQIGGFDSQDPLPRVGSVTININNISSDADLYSVIAHELGHTLGLLGQNQRSQDLTNKQSSIFLGEYSRQANNGQYLALQAQDGTNPVTKENDYSHPSDRVNSIMNYKHLSAITSIDYAMLADIGYKVSGINA